MCLIKSQVQSQCLLQPQCFKPRRRESNPTRDLLSTLCKVDAASRGRTMAETAPTTGAVMPQAAGTEVGWPRRDSNPRLAHRGFSSGGYHSRRSSPCGPTEKTPSAPDFIPFVHRAVVLGHFYCASLPRSVRSYLLAAITSSSENMKPFSSTKMRLPLSSRLVF